MGKKLHIISLDIPYPADYGGVIDIFYKIKSLHKIGIEIILHCFEYGDRKPNNELNKYCKEVFYYKRQIGILGLDTSLPYIVSSRKSEELLKNLLLDDAPILFEGIHTCYYSNHPLLKDRKKILRAHNIESRYYTALAINTQSIFKKIYYLFEANRLKLYEKNLNQFDVILSISEMDFHYFIPAYPKAKHLLIPAFHQHERVMSKFGTGVYCLYHGNLSVAENIKSVDHLINNIFKHLEILLIIAGKNPSSRLVSNFNNRVLVIPNPDDGTLKELIRNAQINVLPNFQQTGLKLKLLQALFMGRHCIVTGEVESSLSDTVHIAESDELFIKKIEELMQKEFYHEELKIRKRCLGFYDNQHYARTISLLL